MSEIELLPARLSAAELDDLQRAMRLIERDSLASKLARALGGNIEWLGRQLPAGAKRAVGVATEAALKTALNVAARTLRPSAGDKPRKASERWHKAAAAASGAIGGAFGFAALAVELPVSTTILMRGIADIARAEGEDLASPAALMACLEVFALGGDGAEATEGGYFAARAMLAQSVSESARYLLSAGLSGESAPVVIRFISQIAARFGVAVSEKLAAQAVPVIGAVGGAAINAAFADHFQGVARGHFIIRRLERRHGAEFVQDEYRRLKHLKAMR